MSQNNLRIDLYYSVPHFTEIEQQIYEHGLFHVNNQWILKTQTTKSNWMVNMKNEINLGVVFI